MQYSINKRYTYKHLLNQLHSIDGHADTDNEGLTWVLNTYRKNIYKGSAKT